MKTSRYAVFPLIATVIFTVTSCGGGGGGRGSSGSDTGQDPELLAGLDSRPANTTCVAPERRSEAVAVQLEVAFPNLPTIANITKMLVEPDSVAEPRWFVLRKTGQLEVFSPAAATGTQLYLDLSGVVDTSSEGGLLGMAFHPDYPTVPQIFLSYTRESSSVAMESVIARFVLNDWTTPGAGYTEQVVLVVDQDSGNHNGGDIAFGADRYLYIGLGDGGGANDPFERSQDTRYLLGSFLRIDVLDPDIRAPATYSIPGDNPFAGNPLCGPGLNAASCPEIYAWGQRNPWRWSFDPETGVLWSADVGQRDWEEVNQIERGGNYGWDCREGATDFEPENCPAGVSLIDPVIAYGRSEGSSTTGGYVYRGAAVPVLRGRYVFGDWGSGRIWALRDNGSGGFDQELLVDSSYQPSAFAVDQFGELYLAHYSGSSGRIYKLVAEPGELLDPVPDNLADSGCVNPGDVTAVSGGAIPFSTVAPFWSDGAAKDRYIAIPDSTTITIDGNDDFVFPLGSVLVKNFRLGGRLIETRHLMLHPDGEWAGYSYEWSADQTTALRVRGGKTVELDVDGELLSWTFPSEAECGQCHTDAAGFALGPETLQLNSHLEYAATGRTANQMYTLDSIGLFTAPLRDSLETLPAMPDPMDAEADLNERARAYLHTNCAQCHLPDGPTQVDLDFRYTTALSDTLACDAPPRLWNGNIEIGARIIAPGDASRSVALVRMQRRDTVGMPPLASNVVDADGVALLTEWVNSLEGCN